MQDPRGFPAMPDHVFRNDGGRFVDVTGATGLVDSDGRGLGVVAADLDDDGKIDLFVANDATPNYFFKSVIEAASSSPRKAWYQAWPRAQAAATWPGWAWLAATSTATAGSTWP